MIKSLAILASSLTLMTCAAIAAETSPVAQVFACNFNDGKGPEDLQAVTAQFNAAIKGVGSADLSESRSYVWLPYVTSTDYDFLWFSAYANLNQLTRSLAAIEGNEATLAVATTFGEMARCSSAILSSETIYDGEGEPTSDNQALLESYSCQLHPGKSLDDARAVVTDWNALVGSLPGHSNMTALLRTPMVANTPADLFYLLVHDSITQFGERQTTYLNSGGAELNAKFDEVHNCESSLWLGSQVVPAAD
jgi:hypothetical protein